MGGGSLHVPWLIRTSLQSQDGLSVSDSKFAFSYKDTSHGFRAHPNPGSPHPDLIASAKTLFPSQGRFAGTRGLGVQLFWGRQSSLLLGTSVLPTVCVVRHFLPETRICCWRRQKRQAAGGGVGGRVV